MVSQPSPAPKSRELWVAPMAGSFLRCPSQIWSKTHQGDAPSRYGTASTGPLPWLAVSRPSGKHHLVIRGRFPPSEPTTWGPASNSAPGNGASFPCGVTSPEHPKLTLKSTCRRCRALDFQVHPQFLHLDTVTEDPSAWAPAISPSAASALPCLAAGV